MSGVKLGAWDKMGERLRRMRLDPPTSAVVREHLEVAGRAGAATAVARRQSVRVRTVQGRNGTMATHFDGPGAATARRVARAHLRMARPQLQAEIRAEVTRRLRG